MVNVMALDYLNCSMLIILHIAYFLLFYVLGYEETNHLQFFLNLIFLITNFEQSDFLLNQNYKSFVY